MENRIKPILFSTPMVQALISENKDQTRREIVSRDMETTALMMNILCGADIERSKSELLMQSRYQIDDILWVKECFCTGTVHDDQAGVFYRADMPSEPVKWKPSIHMPKSAARIFLKITEVRIEFLQDISPNDALCEGLETINEDYSSELGALLADYKNYMWVDNPNYEEWHFPYYSDPINSFRSLWQFINGKESWEVNPLIWVVKFSPVERPFNFLA